MDVPDIMFDPAGTYLVDGYDSGLAEALHESGSHSRDAMFLTLRGRRAMGRGQGVEAERWEATFLFPREGLEKVRDSVDRALEGFGHEAGR